MFPSVEDIQDYMGDTSDSIEAITDALAAETAAQARRCIIPTDPADYPADLAEALKRRVQRNLRMRTVTLPSELAGEYGSEGNSYLPFNDPEIARLERPHRKVVMGW